MALTGEVREVRTRADELRRVIGEVAQRFHAPGIAVAIVSGDDQLIATTGVTSVENPLPVDADTLFKIASVTKPITGTALMKLCELGRLDFDAPLRTYLPDLRLADEDTAARVTMRHVVTHSVGVFSRAGDYGRGDDALAKSIDDLANLPQRAKLGELFCYSSDIRLAGRVIEVLTGETYEAAMQELVLEPLGMTRTCFFATDAITYRVAVGHNLRDGRPHVARPWFENRTGHSTGGLLSTANDLTRFVRLHLGSRGSRQTDRLLSDESVAFMASPLPPDGTHGVTWWRHRVDGLDVVDHGGWYPGFLSHVALVPARHFGIAVLANVERTWVEHRFPEINTLNGKIIEWALETYLNVRVPPDAPIALLDPELADYSGTYLSDVSHLELSIADGRLLATEQPNDAGAKVPEPYHLAFYERDKVFRLDGVGKDTRGQFVRDGDGGVVWFRPFVTTIYRRAR